MDSSSIGFLGVGGRSFRSEEKSNAIFAHTSCSVWLGFRGVADLHDSNIRMHQNNATNASNATLSAIAFDPVPEPTSLGSIAVALGGLLARRRRH